MKTSSAKTALVLALQLAACVPRSWALDDFEVMMEKVRIERAIVDRLVPIFKRYDPNPLINVFVSFQKVEVPGAKRKEDTPLPGTPFTFNNFRITGDGAERPTLKRIEITFYGEKSLYPENMAKLVGQLMYDYRLRPRVQFKELPVVPLKQKSQSVQFKDTLWSYEKSLEERFRPLLLSFDRQAALNVTITPKNGKGGPQEIWTILSAQDFVSKIAEVKITVISRFKQLPSYLINFFNAGLKEMGIVPVVESIQVVDQNPKPQDHWPYVMGIFATFLLYLAWWGRSLAKNLGAAKVAQGERGRGEALAEAEAVPGPVEREEAPETPDTSKRGPEAFVVGLPLEGLEALLSDCYWCERDGYALFIWRRISVQERKALLERVPHLRPYFNGIMDLEEANLGKEMDPNYLNPLPISHLNNQEVGRLVESDPQLLGRLSLLRKEHLPINLPDLIRMVEQLPASSGAGKSGFDLNMIKASPLRSFGIKIGKSLQTQEEEEKVLSLPHLTLEIKRTIPSLGWLLELDEDERGEILSSYSARKLAQCWVGPGPVLRELSEGLPKRKAELLLAYLKKSTPSRSSPLLLRIHLQAMEKLALRQGDGAGKLGGARVA